MCRTGGRRCPSHSDPLKVAEYNAVRRLRYSENKGNNLVISDEDYGFQPFNENRTPTNPKADGTSPEAIIKFREETKAYRDILLQHEDGLDPENRHGSTPLTALNFYTGGGYSVFRKVLNGYDLILNGKEMPLRYDEATVTSIRSGIANMDKALKLAPIQKEPRVVYRGMRIPASVAVEDIPNWLNTNFPKDGVISQPGFMSTTLNPRLASYEFADYKVDEATRGVMIEIMTKRGAPLGEGISSQGENEHEYVIERDARFKVVSVTEDVNYKTDLDNIPTGKLLRTVIRLVDVDDEGDSNVQE